eukprot:12429574-Karenia_brevis.AAC.1
MVWLEAIASEPFHLASSFCGAFVLIEALNCREISEVADGNTVSKKCTLKCNCNMDGGGTSMVI